MFKKTRHALPLLFCLLASLPLAAQQHASQYWSTVSPLPDSLTLYGLYQDGAQTIAVGERGAILTSTNGSDWQARPSSLSIDFYDIADNGSLYVAIGWGGTIQTSTDLNTWQTQYTGDYRLRSIAYNGFDRFVAVGDGQDVGGVLLTSTNGTNWTKIDYSDLKPSNTKITGYPLRQVIWDDGKFFIVSRSLSLLKGLIMTSSDGTTWSAQLIDNAYFHSISGNGSGRLVAVGDCLDEFDPDGPDGPIIPVCLQSPIYYSSNGGASWTAAPGSFSAADLRGVTFGNGLFLAVGEAIFQNITDDNGKIIGSLLIEESINLYSNDGITWNTWDNWVTSPKKVSKTLYTAIWDSANSQFIVAGTNILLTSTDPTTPWTSQTSGLSADLTGIAHDSGSLSLAVSSNGEVFASGDGFTWALPTSTVYTFNAITWDGSQFVAIADGDKVVTSTNGNIWTQLAASGLSSGLNGIASNGASGYVIVGNNDVLLTSTNLTAWGPPSSVPAISGDLTGITWNADANTGSGEFLVVTNNSQVLHGSTDGLSWTAQDTDNINSNDPLPVLHAIAWNGVQYVAVGDSSDVFYSDDGNSWQHPPNPDTIDAQRALRGISWHSGQKRFIAVGDGGTILASAGTELNVFALTDPSTATDTQTLNYTYTVQNNSSFTATGVTLTLDIPIIAEAEFRYYPGNPFDSSGIVCTQAGQTLTCPVGELTANAKRQLFLGVAPFDPLVNSNLTTTATVTAFGPEARPNDNQITTATFVQSLEVKFTNDFNNSFSGSGRLSPWLGLILAAGLLINARRRFSRQD